MYRTHLFVDAPVDYKGRSPAYAYKEQPEMTSDSEAWRMYLSEAAIFDEVLEEYKDTSDSLLVFVRLFPVFLDFANLIALSVYDRLLCSRSYSKQSAMRRWHLTCCPTLRPPTRKLLSPGNVFTRLLHHRRLQERSTASIEKRWGGNRVYVCKDGRDWEWNISKGEFNIDI